MLFDKMNSPFIIGGDFNAKHTRWVSRFKTTNDPELYSPAADIGCEVVSIGKPTYRPTNPRTPYLSDFVVVKDISTIIKIQEGFDLNSNHSSTCLTVI
jgi:hypothetical protein